MLYSKNDVITLDDDKITITDLLGEGGQGEVYLVDYGGRKYALKVYKNEVSADFRYNLKNNIDKGSPSDSFLWPKMLLDFANDRIGYLMDLRPKNYVSFVSYLTGKNAFASYETLLTWCINLCLAFKKLHEKGYSYQDLNDGSFFLDPNSGDLLICDNDNVTADKKNLGILGKMRYMAPEIVRNERMPDVHSDRFSLGVILFMALCLGNPYEGERLKNYDIIDERAEYELFGSAPVFVYHKQDRSNRPIRGYHGSVIRRWAHIPLYVKEAFHRTFVDGLTDRENGRTTEIEWLRLLTNYRDELLRCPDCGREFIFGFGEKAPVEVCPNCGKPKKQVCVLQIGKHRIVLDLGKKITAAHLDKFSAEYNKAMATVVANKSNPSLWGIRLDLPAPVTVQDAHGVVKTIPANGVIPIVKDLQIQFSETIQGGIK